MIEVTTEMVDRVAAAINSWLVGWVTPDDFSDFVEDDRATVAIEILVDCTHGIYIARRAAERLDIALTDEDLKYDDGYEALEEGVEQLAAKLQTELDKRDIPGQVFFGSMDHTGDYALQWTIDVDDLPYP